MERRSEILIVDDSQVMRSILKTCLRGLGNCTLAESAEAAKKQMESQRFDVALIDQMMPLKTGIELTADIRQQWSAKELPIILISGALDAAMEWNALRTGANECLRKPAERAKLVETVKRVMETGYQREPDPTRIIYRTLEWDQGKTHYAYCPEINQRTQGATRERAIEDMEGLIRAFTRREGWPDHISQTTTQENRMVL